MVNAATDLNDLRVPPGHTLHPFKDDRAGGHAIRVNASFAIADVHLRVK
jgi:proteic killer suppression protein